jgi:hypothetical protein
VEQRETALWAFLDTVGASDKTSFEVLIKAGEQHRIGCTICRWAGPILGSVIIMATLAGETLKGFVTGCHLWREGGRWC